MEFRLYVVKKVSANGFVYFVLGADTNIEDDIILTMKEDTILKFTDMRKSELLDLETGVKKYLN